MTTPGGRADELAQHAPGLFRLALGLTAGDATAAEDLAQETLARALRHPPRTELSWPCLRRIATNLAIDTSRHDRRGAGVLQRLAARRPTAVAGPAEDVHDRLTVTRLLGQLDGTRRAVVVLRWYADLPFGEIARIIDRPEGTTRRLAAEALETLRRLADPGDL